MHLLRRRAPILKSAPAYCGMLARTLAAIAAASANKFLVFD
jgi:hypothetical protein